MDKIKIRKRFARIACAYERSAFFQSFCGKRVLQELISNFYLASGNLLDVGCGTAKLLREIRIAFPKVKAFGIDPSSGMISVCRGGVSGICQAEGEKLPFKDKVFSSVVSNVSYQWARDLKMSFDEAFRVLEPGGRFVFSIFGRKTFGELNICLEEMGLNQGFVPLPSSEDVLSALALSGFKDVQLDVLDSVQEYSSLFDMLRWFKNTGSAYRGRDLGRGLGGRKLISRLEERYMMNFPDGGSIKATFEVIFIKCRKEEGT